MRPKRIHELDALRGIAACSVLVYHYVWRYDLLFGHAFPVGSLVTVGRLGVPLFFVISGFVIYWTLNRTPHALDFAVARFSRLYPAYWAAVVVTYAAVLVCGLPGREVTAVEAMINLSMLQEFLFVEHVDGVYWTLTIELVFYFWILVLFLSRLLRRLEPIALGWIAAAMVFLLVEQDGPICKALERILLLRYGNLFFAGVMFYRIWAGQQGRTSYAVLALSAACNFLAYPWHEALIVCGFYGIFALLIFGRLRVLDNRALVFLGAISYPLYLIHQNIGYVVIKNGYRLGFPPVVSIAAATCIAVALAWLLHRFVEMPAMHQIRSWYQQSGAARRLVQSSPVLSLH